MPVNDTPRFGNDGDHQPDVYGTYSFMNPQDNDHYVANDEDDDKESLSGAMVGCNDEA